MKISIIIPVYNSTKYLKECVESILNQTYKDVEVLLIDDGSTDDSSKICDQYAIEDARIRVVHKENGGTSDARNVGLTMAQGDYVTFMDNDDFWDDNCALERIVTIVKETSPDVVMHTNKVYWENTHKTTIPASFERKKVCGKSREEVVAALLKAGVLTVTVWTKVVKISLIREHELYFEKGIRNEDTDWIARLLLCAQSFEWYDKPFYVYRKGHETAQTSQSLKYNMLADLKHIIEKYTKIARQELQPEYREVFLSYLAYPYAVWMGQSYIIEQDERIKKDRKEMRAYTYLLKYNIQPAVKMVYMAYCVLRYHLTAKLLMLYIKKVYQM